MNACEKKSKSLLEKPDIRYPVTSGYPNPDFQNLDIWYPGSKSVSGTTLILSSTFEKDSFKNWAREDPKVMLFLEQFSKCGNM